MAHRALKAASNAGMASKAASVMADTHQDEVNHSVAAQAEQLQAHLQKYGTVAAEVAADKIERGKDMIQEGKEQIKDAQRNIKEAKKQLVSSKSQSKEQMEEAKNIAKKKDTLSAEAQLKGILKDQQKYVEKTAMHTDSVKKTEQREIRESRREVSRGKKLIATGKQLLEAPKLAAKEASGKALRAAGLRKERAVRKAGAQVQEAEDAVRREKDLQAAQVKSAPKSLLLEAKLKRANLQLAKAQAEQAIDAKKDKKLSTEITKIQNAPGAA